MKDTDGREYLKLAEAKAGQTVELDDDFSCHAAGHVMLSQDGKFLYFECANGRHYIDAHKSGIHCVGIYPVRIN